MDKVNLQEKFSLFKEHWSPKIVGELNGQQVKLVKFMGPFVWHHHETEDELFFVAKGRFRMEFRDHEVVLEAGEFLIVPRGVEHRPVADEEVQVLNVPEPLHLPGTRERFTLDHAEPPELPGRTICFEVKHPVLSFRTERRAVRNLLSVSHERTSRSFAALNATRL